MREKVEDYVHSIEFNNSKQEGKEENQARQQQPPSPSSSPSHEFSFTISLHHHHHQHKLASPSIAALDLSPADEIFFHGHLLPLHLLSHLPVSPRSSTNSLDSFTLPIRDLLQDPPYPNPNPNHTIQSQNNSENIFSHEKTQRPKSKSFSFFGLSSRWKKGYEEKEKEEKDKQKRKIVPFLKRYMGMVRPMLSFRGSREKVQLRRQPHSFSGSMLRSSPRGMRRGGEFSAPASIRTSPTNSGLLVPNGAVSTSTSDSTMEELQAAIQAAIAHCKKSIAMEDKDKVKC